jgi:Putative auto-transporter adhesin, head GIN domain
MIRRIIRFGFLASALGAGGLLALATTVRETVHGSGTPATEERGIGNATEVELSGVGDLTIVQGEVPSLKVTADDNVLPALETETEGRTLTIRTKSRTSIRAQTPITYTLTVPRLSAITISGAGTVTTRKLEADGLTVKLSGAGKANLDNLKCNRLELRLSGAGTAKLGGETDKLTLRLSGAGGIDAGGLKATAAEVRVSGAGHATVWATNDLNARVSGAGGVKYKGAPPHLEQKTSGAGKIRPID